MSRILSANESIGLMTAKARLMVHLKEFMGPQPAVLAEAMEEVVDKALREAVDHFGVEITYHPSSTTRRPSGALQED